MYTTYLLIALAIAGANAQNAAEGGESGVGEPYSYGYQTDTHAASEQRDPQGRVTGYYNIVDADGRQRRVDYVADEAGFRAKVQTNEVGTKSENSADVEVLASPANPEQFAYQAPAQQQVQVQRTVQQVAPQVAVSQVARTSGSYVQQPYGYYGSNYGYNPGFNYGARGYGYNNGAYGYNNGAYGYNNGVYGYAPQVVGYGYGDLNNAGYGYGSTYSSYNNHLPSQYYKNLVQPSSYNAGSVTSGYVSPVTTSGYRTVQGVPASYGYQTVQSAPAGYSSSTQARSSNYVVLKKRESEAAKESQKKN